MLTRDKDNSPYLLHWLYRYSRRMKHSAQCPALRLCCRHTAHEAVYFLPDLLHVHLDAADMETSACPVFGRALEAYCLQARQV